MIASDLDGTLPVADIKWTRSGLRSFEELLHFVAAQEYADPLARAREIRLAILTLAQEPCGCPAVLVRREQGFRRCVVSRKFLVYYVYTPSPDVGRPGSVSIRAVLFGRRLRQFAGVRGCAPERSAPREGAALMRLTFADV